MATRYFAESNFDLAVNSFYVQDEWTPNGDLTVKFGVRFDQYDNSDNVVANPAFTARNGFSNTTNLDGKDLVLPRIGFNWTPTDRLTLRGGVGQFGGGAPLIIVSNSYAGNGVTRTFAAFLAPFFDPATGIPAAIDAAVRATARSLTQPSRNCISSSASTRMVTSMQCRQTSRF